jgi:hypothetical protein
LFLPLASADSSVEDLGRGVHDACLLCEAKALVRWHGLILGGISQKLTTEFGRYVRKNARARGSVTANIEFRYYMIGHHVVSILHGIKLAF